MSTKLHSLLKASLENDAPVAEVDRVLEKLQAVEEQVLEVAEPSAHDIVNDNQDGQMLVDAVDALADKAEQSVEQSEEVSKATLESLQLSSAVLFHSHGVQMARESFESFGTTDEQLGALAAQLRGKADKIRSHLRTSMEGGFSNIRDEIHLIERKSADAGRAINSAMTFIKSNEKRLNESPVVVNHLGMYYFLQYMRKPVPSLKGVMKRELDSIGEMIKVAGKFSAFYTELVKLAGKIHGSDQRSIREFVQHLMSFDYEREMKKLHGLHLLNNGELHFNVRTRTVQFEETTREETRVDMGISYLSASNDGSRAPEAERREAAQTSKRVGQVFGGIYGAILGFILSGVTDNKIIKALVTVGSGVGLGWAFGKFMGAVGEEEADQRYAGTHTSSTSSTDDLLEFLKDALLLPKMIRPLHDSVKDAERDNDKVSETFNRYIDTISGTELAITIIADIGMAMLGGESNYLASRHGAVKELVAKRLEEIRLAHTQLCESAAYHTYLCITGTTKVAELVVEQLKVSEK